MDKAMIRMANFDPTGTYRYSLHRAWQDSLPSILFVMLNPSTADSECEDPTIRRCIGFARAWGYGSLEVVNLFAYRATTPAALFRAEEPVGPENDRAIGEAVARAGRVLVAWGCHGARLGRGEAVLPLLGDANCLGITRAGQPRHPLYVSADTPPVPFSWQS